MTLLNEFEDSKCKPDGRLNGSVLGSGLDTGAFVSDKSRRYMRLSLAISMPIISIIIGAHSGQG